MLHIGHKEIVITNEMIFVFLSFTIEINQNLTPNVNTKLLEITSDFTPGTDSSFNV